MGNWVVGACVIVCAATGCLQSATRLCGDRTCPASYVCSPDGVSCALPAQVSACDGRSDGVECEYLGTPGTCSGGVCADASCGNVRIEAGEQCDDGNRIDGDGCSRDCSSNETCGNGIVDSAEGCDCGTDAGAVPTLCSGVNSTDVAATCSTSCTIHGCGDGVVDASRFEQCEPALGVAQDACQQLGYYTGTAACNGLCRFESIDCAQRCGDGTINGPELCDGQPPSGSTCASYGFDYGRLGCMACAPNLASCGVIGWIREPVPTDEGLRAVWLDGAGGAFAGGTEGAILRRSSMGWTQMSSGTTADIRAIWGRARATSTRSQPSA